MVNEPVETLRIAGETPWSVVETPLPLNPSVDDVMATGALNFEVETRQMYYHPPGGGALRPAKDYAVVRADTGTHLGTVKEGYVPYQNREAMELARPMVDKGEIEIITAGSINGGAKVFCLAEIKKDPVDVVPGDPVQRYFLFGTGHGGGMSVFGLGTNLRTACTNIVRSALNSAQDIMRVTHSKQVHENAEMMWRHIDLANRQFKTSVQMYTELAYHDINHTQFDRYVRDVFARKTRNLNEEIADKARLDKIVEKVQVLFESGRGTEIPGVKGTWWGAFNSVTEYLNYERGRDTKRFDSLVFGSGAGLSTKALRKAKEMALA